MKGVFSGDFLNKMKNTLNLEQVNNIDESFFETKKITKFVARPGLALAGFFDHFDQNRIQIFGETEVLYIKNFSEDTERKIKMENFLKLNIPMIIVSKDKLLPQFFINLADKYNVPIYKTVFSTDELYTKLRSFLDEELAKRLTIDASLISVYNVGILIEGNEGYGKSETTLELIKNGHQFVSDGKVLLKNIRGKLIGEARKEITKEKEKYSYPLEIKGIGKIKIDEIFGVKSILERKEINIRVIFSKNDNLLSRELEINLKSNYRPLLNVKIPIMYVNIATNKSVATIIEMIAINYLQKTKYDKKKD